MRPEITFKFYRKWCLFTVPWTRVGYFDEIYALFDVIYQDMQTVETGEIEENETGAIYLFINRSDNQDSVVSTWSYDNKQYKIFEQLRIQLSDFWIQRRKLLSLDPAVEKEYSKMSVDFIESLVEYSKNVDISHHLATYCAIVDKLFEQTKTDLKARKQLLNKYPQYIANLVRDFTISNRKELSEISTCSKLIENQDLIGYRKPNQGEITK